MAVKNYNVLFICTGNSARSILAEGLLNHLGSSRGFRGYSAGSQPKGSVHALTLKTLADHRIPTNDLRNKSWEEFAKPGATEMDFVFTVCDQAAGEACPAWPGQPMTAHWGVPDPAAVQGSEEAKAKAFLDAFVAMKRRIELMLALPMQTIDRLAIHREVKDIGKL